MMLMMKKKEQEEEEEDDDDDDDGSVHVSSALQIAYLSTKAAQTLQLWKVERLSSGMTPVKKGWDLFLSSQINMPKHHVGIDVHDQYTQDFLLCQEVSGTKMEADAFRHPRNNDPKSKSDESMSGVGFRNTSKT